MDLIKNEGYKPHPDYPQYLISSWGNVYSAKTKKNLKIHIDKDGYRHTFLTIEGKNKRKQVHRLMAETFIPNPENKPMVCFETSRKDVPKICDLFWCDPKQRTRNAYKRGFYPSQRKTHRKVRTVVTDDLIHRIIELLVQGHSYNYISDKLNVSYSVVYKVKHNKYHIKYPETIKYFVF